MKDIRSPNISATIQMVESSPWYKLYAYGLCKGKPTPKIAGYRVQYLHNLSEF